MIKRNSLLRTVLALSVSGLLGAQYSWGTPEEGSHYVAQIFAVENMTCAACPITVRKAMSRVDGVQSVEVNFEAKTVTATYDPALTDTTSIAEASTAVGFPAQVHAESP
ncbi:MAG: heavy metal-associated domain-containing protein [Pseudomonadota bacterium]